MINGERGVLSQHPLNPIYIYIYIVYLVACGITMEKQRRVQPFFSSILFQQQLFYLFANHFFLKCLADICDDHYTQYTCSFFFIED